jgi:hypothetical protein
MLTQTEPWGSQGFADSIFPRALTTFCPTIGKLVAESGSEPATLDHKPGVTIVWVWRRADYCDACLRLT